MTRNHLRPMLWLALCAALATTAAGCTRELTENHRPCPCSEGWTCCANECVPEGQFCAEPTPNTPPGNTPPRDTTAPDMPRLTGSQTGLLTRQRAMTVKGTAEANATVSVYLNPNCAGAAAKTGSADAEGLFELTVTLLANTRTSLSANARDAAGNTSPCNGSALWVDHDDVSPVVSAWGREGPPTGRATSVTLRGTTEAAARVSLFAGEQCEGTPLAEQAASPSGDFSFAAEALANQTSRWTVRATDAAGNESTCFAEAASYAHDDIPPAPPEQLSSQSSMGTARSLSFSGTAEPGATVRMWLNATCSGDPSGSSVVPSEGGWSFSVLVARNATTRFSFHAEDAAHNVSECEWIGSYVHDDLPPTLSQLATSPASPNNVTRSPVLTGLTEPYAQVTVVGSECGTGNGKALGNTWADKDGNFRIELSLPEDACTLVLQTIDGLDNANWNAASLRYVYDATPPPPPARLRLAAPSPSAAETRVSVFGTAPLDARVQVFSQDGCKGPVQAEVIAVRGPTAADPTWFEAPLEAAAETTTRYSARTVDGVGNVSGCVAVTGAFVHASGAPGWRAREELSFGPRQLAHDEQGFTFALDSQSTSSSSSTPLRVKVARRASAGDGTSWGTPRELTSGAANEPRLAVNARGDAAVVWAERSGLDPVRLVRFDSRTGAWTEPLALTVLGSPTGQVAVTLDAGGDVTACWVSRHSDDIERVWCARVPAAGPVEASETLANVTWNTRLEGALTAGGQVLLVWSEDLGDDKRGYRARTYVPGTGWGAMSDPTEGATGALRMGTTRHGLGWVAYSGVSGTSLRRFDPAAGGLQAAELVAPREFEELSVLLEPEGDTVIGGAGWTSTTVWVGHRAPGGAWTSSTVTVPTVLGSYSMKLTTAAPGEAWVFWEARYGPIAQDSEVSYWRAGIWAQRFRAGSGWGEVRLLEVDPSSYVNLVAADGQPDGLVTLTWRHATSNGEYPSALRIFR